VEPIHFKQRAYDKALLAQPSELHPVLQRVLSARGIESYDEIQYDLKRLLPPAAVTNLEQGGAFLAEHVLRDSSILIFGDYDADGATSTALCLRALHMMGHRRVDFLLPDRMVDGYGLSPNVAERIVDLDPDLVITVDTGIASRTGIKLLRGASIDVLVTDHHLPGEQLPDANEIVNPNALDGGSGNCLAGVGVAFYLMLALRAQLRQRGWFEAREQPNLADCLDLVAVGTVADLVPLDYNNRILVNEGLKRIRAGACALGISKLIEVTGRNQRTIGSQDIAFALAPRINAAGRLDDMRVGVEALLASDELSAARLATELDEINRYRRELQGEMTEQALKMLPEIDTDSSSRYCHVLYEPDWHEGIVGIIASKVKDLSFRPVVSFARSSEGKLKGSCRSIPGIHIRDTLDLLDKKAPGLIERFGGHAMAAGLTIAETNLQRFSAELEKVIEQYADPSCFENTVYHDGEIPAAEFGFELAEALRRTGPWGQKFPVPSFCGKFNVLSQRILAERHIKFQLSPDDGATPIDAILFYAKPDELRQQFKQVHIHYELNINEFRNQENLQLTIRHLIS
jgi:single-stranded-DNA-specific exonuclease